MGFKTPMSRSIVVVFPVPDGPKNKTFSFFLNSKFNFFEKAEVPFSKEKTTFSNLTDLLKVTLELFRSSGVSNFRKVTTSFKAAVVVLIKVKLEKNMLD